MFITKLLPVIFVGLLVTVVANELERRNYLTELGNKMYRLVDTEVISKVPLVFQADKPKLLRKPRFFQHTSIPFLLANLNSTLLSICAPKEVGTINCTCSKTYSKPVSIFNQKENTQTIVTVNKKFKQIVVSYQPTINFFNALDDLDHVAEPVDFAPKYVKVHRGFYRNYLTTRQRTQREVIKILKNPRYKEYPLHVTGYSLGAAAATMSAFDWSRILKRLHDNRKLEIFSYSGPRVGNNAFADRLHQLNIPVTRFTSSNDLVPHLPPRSFGYVHAGAEIYAYTSSKEPSKYKLKVCRQRWDEDPECAWKNYGFPSFATHLRPLGQLLNGPPYC